MKNITAYGEILFDIYPENKNLGGAPFNFIYHINKLTGAGNFISSVGNDEPGREILSFMNNNNISTRYVKADEKHSTGAAYANLDENKIPHWEIRTDCAYDFIETSREIIDLVDTKTDCLYFGTLAQRNTVSAGTLKNLLGRQIVYFCDLNLRQNFYSSEIIKHSLNAADVLKLNNDELKVINDTIIKQDYNEVNLMKYISSEYNIKLVCITLGEKGAILYGEGNSDYFKASAENVIDTVGAGDAYASILCLGYMHSWSLETINKVASEFSAAIVQVNGALPAEDKFYEKFRERIDKLLQPDG